MFINQWNSNKERTHNISHNRFSDWTEAEKKKLRGYLGQSNNTIGQKNLKNGPIFDI